MISSGRLSTVSVLGEYWMSWISSFWIDHLALGDGDVLAELEGVRVGHLDGQLAAPALEVREQIVQAAQQVLAAGLGGPPQHLGVGEQEVGRAHRVDELARVKIDLLRGLGVEPVDVAHHVLHVAGGEQVGLLDEVEDLVLLPGVILEAAVLRVRLDHRLGLAVHAEDPARRVLPERHVVLPEPDLRLHQVGRVLHELRRHFHEGVADIHWVEPGGLVRLPVKPLGHQALRAFGDVGHRAAEYRRVGELETRAVGGGFSLANVGHNQVSFPEPPLPRYATA